MRPPPPLCSYTPRALSYVHSATHRETPHALHKQDAPLWTQQRPSQLSASGSGVCATRATHRCVSHGVRVSDCLCSPHDAWPNFELWHFWRVLYSGDLCRWIGTGDLAGSVKQGLSTGRGVHLGACTDRTACRAILIAVFFANVSCPGVSGRIDRGHGELIVRGHWTTTTRQATNTPRSRIRI